MAAQRFARLNGYREEVHFALDMGEGSSGAMLPERQWLSRGTDPA